MIVDIKQSPTTSITNNTTVNNVINLNMFLTEKCGGAMNLDDFIKGICFESVNLTKMKCECKNGREVFKNERRRNNYCVK
jgi:hypothetical protein